MNQLNPEYWNSRYLENNTPWDIGQVSPPLLSILDSISDEQTKILIPGAGTAYEAIYLHQKGFAEVYVCDWAPDSFVFLKKHCPDFPDNHLLVQDFFELEGPYDIILEQTFFCALMPSEREAYSRKAAQLLRKGGLLAGVLFASEFDKPGPPFGGNAAGYRACFSPHFKIETMEPCSNSISPRLGNELLVKLIVL